jgi:hypothetical protein
MEEDVGLGGSEYLYVDGFDGQRTGWSTAGTAPYLQATGAGGWIYTSTDAAQEGDFNFTDSTKFGAFSSSQIELYSQQAGTLETITVYIHDGSTWNNVGSISPDASYSWKSLPTSTVLDTKTKIDSAKMYVVYTKSGKADSIDLDAARIYWTATASPHYEHDVEFTTDSVGSGDTNILEINYSVDGTENFGVLVYNTASSIWDDFSAQGDLTSTSFTTKNYTITSNHISDDGVVRVRYVGRDQVEGDSSNSTLNIEFHRINTTNAYYPLPGEGPNDRFGWSVSGLTDINKDGSYDDVVVGAPDYNLEPLGPVWNGGSDDQLINQYEVVSEQIYPDVAIDSAGNAIVIWEDDRNGDPYIYGQKFEPDGNPLWSSSDKRINQYTTAGSNNQRPRVAISSNDTIYVAWHSYHGSEWKPYAQRLNSTGDAQWGTSDDVLVTSVSTLQQTHVAICVDSNDDLVIAWRDGRDGGGDVNIYAQKLNYSGGKQWGSTDKLLSHDVEAKAQANVEIASDSQGNTIAVWEDRRVLEDYIYAQKLNSTGDPQWDANDVKIGQNDGSSNQFSPEIACDSEDNVIIVWDDDRNGGLGKEDIYAQKYNPTGDPQWDASEVKINQLSDTTPQTFPTIAIDSNDDAIITWRDGRVSYDDIYMQKVNSDGIAQWGSSDVKVNDDKVNENQTKPEIAIGPNDNLVIVWRDDRNGSTNEDVYGQRFECNKTGRAYIFYGGDPMSLVAFINLTGEQYGDKFGYSVHYAGDVDGDNDPDVIVGAPFFDNGSKTDCGKIYVFCGGANMDSAANYTRSGEFSGDHFGWSVSDAGDLNNDGNNDTIAGAPHYNTRSSESPPSAIDVGKAYVNSMQIGEPQQVPEIPEFHTIFIPFVMILILIMVTRKKRRLGNKNVQEK